MTLFLLIAAVWAVFLLPPLWAGWYYSPTTSTRRFSKLTAPLDDAPVPSRDTYRSSGGGRAQERARKLARRRRVLSVLAAAAFGTLIVAALSRNIWMVVLHISSGAALAWYAVMLRRIKERERPAKAARPRLEPKGSKAPRYRPEAVSSRVRSGVR